MRKRIAMVLPIVVGLVGAAIILPAPVGAQGSKSDVIVEIRVPVLDLFDDKGQKVGEVKPGSVTLPLPVRDESPNGRLKIIVDGRPVWIDKARVKLRPSAEVPPCDPGRGVVAGATRGSAERCK